MRTDDARHRLDAAIDAAARQLTTGEPSPRMRAGVRERIARRRAAWWGAPAWSIASAVVAVLVIVVWQRSDAPPSPAGVDRGRDVMLASEVLPLAPPAAPSPVRIRAARPAVRASASAAPLPPHSPLVIGELTIAPLDEGPVELQVIETPMPLRADRLTFEPLVIQ